MKVIRKQREHSERSDKEEVVSNSSWKELSEVKHDCNIQEKGRMKLMIHTGKYITQLLTSQLALMMKTVTTTRIMYMKRKMYSRTKLKKLLEMKEVEIVELQIVKEQIVTAALTCTTLCYNPP